VAQKGGGLITLAHGAAPVQQGAHGDPTPTPAPGQALDESLDLPLGGAGLLHGGLGGVQLLPAARQGLRLDVEGGDGAVGLPEELLPPRAGRLHGAFWVSNSDVSG